MSLRDQETRDHAVRRIKFQMYPTKTDVIALNDALYHQRMLYNAALQERDDIYQKHIKPLNLEIATRRASKKTSENKSYQSYLRSGEPRTPNTAVGIFSHLSIDGLLATKKKYSNAASYMGQTNSVSAINADANSVYLKYPSSMNHGTLNTLDCAFRNFFKRPGVVGYPKFQGKHRYTSLSFRNASGWSLTHSGLDKQTLEGETKMKNGVSVSSDVWYLYIQGVHTSKQQQRIKCRGRLNKITSLNRPSRKTTVLEEIESGNGVITNATIINDAGKWYLSIAYKTSLMVEEDTTPSGEVGIDWGVKQFLTTYDSSGNIGLVDHVTTQRHMKKHTQRIKELQRKLAKQQKGSSRRAKTVKALQVLHLKLRQIKTNFNHEETTRLARTFSKCITEDIAFGNLTKNISGTVDNPTAGSRSKSGLNRAILETSPSTFFDMLTYKMIERGGELVKVDTVLHAPSQTCSKCGNRKSGADKIDMSVRTYQCAACGHEDDRDVNAAKNILKVG